VTPEGISDDLNVADAAVVLDIEADLVAFGADLRRSPEGSGADHTGSVAVDAWQEAVSNPHRGLAPGAVLNLWRARPTSPVLLHCRPGRQGSCAL
jgi:hypothetical protein